MFGRFEEKGAGGMPGEVNLSVRTLVEYAYRSGSIESGFRTAASLTEGTKAHKQVQSGYGEEDQKEVHLALSLEHEGVRYVIEGRCDGLLKEGGGMTVDEIKSTSGRLADIREDTYPVHWAQAQCYAYMYARLHGLERMGIRLTYIQVDSGERILFTREAAAAELEAFMEETIARYAPYASMQLQHEEARTASIRALSFPFPSYREGQRNFAGAVYKAIEGEKQLFVRAPTGTGKTISTLFPAVKAMGEGLLSRMFYLTAKTITRTVAEEALTLMEGQGLRLKSVTITAKEKVCFKEEVRCTREACEYADGYYDRINGAVLDLLSHETRMSREVIARYAEKHRVCPFEFSLDAAYAADCVICDYNYIFDPRVSLKRTYEEGRRRTALLIDEAHNLVDRAREMFSAELAKSAFLAVQRAYKEVRPAVSEAAKTVNAWFTAYRKGHEGVNCSVLPGLPEELLQLLEQFGSEAEEELGQPSAGAEAEGQQLLLDTYFAAHSFLRIAGLYDPKRHVTYGEWDRRDVRLKLFCIDPSSLLQGMAKGYRSRIYFSATLAPFSYYMEMLGGQADDYAISIPSPFSPGQWEITIYPWSTRYRDRERTKNGIVELIRRLAKQKPGNHLVFFPSYEYMKLIGEELGAGEGELAARLRIQLPGMTEEDRETFLDAFSESGGVIGLAVLGGIFSEGIDLRGDRLTSVVIVGVGLPQVSFERSLIQEHFDRSGEGRRGFDYAYVIPGMNKVLQAGGRLIRTESDRGSLTLIDDRFLQGPYKYLLPKEWAHASVMKSSGR
ncbi:Rad3-related DNA helicase [Paenibacillus mucilaginosus]|uniref:helicase C-terminal domain-containing protein n=1 Tax=Paenibacillus mucilaginosus TaxID=61624 RepID=UPI003D206619